MDMQADLFPEARSKPEEDPNSRYTPREFITQLHAAFRFTVDAASALDAPSSHVIGRFWSKLEDGLQQDWTGERVFVNPPWDDMEAWVRKAWGSRADLVLMLAPAWTDRIWWQELVEPFRDARHVVSRFTPDWRIITNGPPPMGRQVVTPPCDEPWRWCLNTEFLPRLRFGHPGNPNAVGVDQPSFWPVLLLWRRPLSSLKGLAADDLRIQWRGP